MTKWLVLASAIVWVVSPFRLVIVRVSNERRDDAQMTLAEGTHRRALVLKAGERRTIAWVGAHHGDSFLSVETGEGQKRCGYIGRPSTIILVTASGPEPTLDCRMGIRAPWF